jgi:hypothetical protein
MRLLKFGSHGEISLTKDFVDNAPHYAILSHTWGVDEDEVTFIDLENGSGTSKAGYAKLQFCGKTRSERRPGILLGGQSRWLRSGSRHWPRIIGIDWRRSKCWQEHIERMDKSRRRCHCWSRRSRSRSRHWSRIIRLDWHRSMSWLQCIGILAAAKLRST